jgi:hypothetical protein
MEEKAHEAVEENSKSQEGALEVRRDFLFEDFFVFGIECLLSNIWP